MKTVTIKTNNKSVFNDKFDKLIKKCNKIGFDIPVILDTEETYCHTGTYDCFGDPIKETVWNITIEYDIPVIDGWKVVGNREKNENMIITNCFDNAVNLESYHKSEKIFCDHCNTNHYRKKSILIQNEKTGSVIEVGTACLKDFVSIPVKDYMVFSDFENFADDEEFWGSSEKIYSYDVKNVLIVTASIVRQFGYVNKSKASEYGVMSTSETVLEYYFNKNVNLDIINDDKKVAENVIEYFKSLNVDDYTNNNYMVNCIKLVSSESANVKYFGYVCSSIVVYNKMMENKQESNSEFVGNVDEKISVDVVLVDRKIVNGYYGDSQLLTFKDDNGNILKSFYSGKNDYYEFVGKEMVLKGTVSKHDTWKDVKQTILKRISTKEN